MIRQEAFDVVVLDRILPRMDGIEVLNRLQGSPRPPVLILSANDQTSDRVDGLRAGAEDYLGKPFDFTDLLLRLEILARRRAQTAGNES
ncbi:response regulator transcription factor, partial [Pandoraea sputorum]|uniref:response regulator transcription factor n=1 Tax=Pandoraea sputorum TaxID=93222 RepID=UPI003558BF12